ncbi:MAG: PTS sugar transporter subunit IIC [Clostridiales bacterium]|nr:PTS sugar transporter subunit IIC [Clostridiales bacterium]
MEEPKKSKMSQDTKEKESFLKRKNVVISFQRYAIDALGAMALGLFASLLIGTIIKTLAENICAAGLMTTLSGLSGTELTEQVAALTGWQNFCWMIWQVGNYATQVTGAAMAVAIGCALQAPPLVLFSLCAVGQATNTLGGSGGPLAVLFVAIIACEVGKLVSKETKVDIIVTPAVTILVGVLCAMALCPIFKAICDYLGTFIGWATNLQPFLMGIIISVVVGVVLTLPISSAAICAAIGISGGAVLAGLTDGSVSMEVWNGLALAGGAATVGCCTQMLGYAVISYPDNGVGGLVAQGLGTSMLQVPNLMKKPVLWIPPIITSAILGPLSTCVFQLRNNGAAISSGMGTSGLVGPIGVITGWSSMPEGYMIGAKDWIGLLLLCFVLPILLNWLIGKFMRARGWIKEGDLKVDLG